MPQEILLQPGEFDRVLEEFVNFMGAQFGLVMRTQASPESEEGITDT